jgi:serine/threonine protein phosphatase PrpC
MIVAACSSQFGKSLITHSDGHGVYGHDVSGYLRDNLPYYLNREFNKFKTLPTFDMNKIITESFLVTNARLFNEQSIDTNFSGSTCVSVIYTPEKLICANVGDSRAVLGRYVNGSKLFYII